MSVQPYSSIQWTGFNQQLCIVVVASNVVPALSIQQTCVPAWLALPAGFLPEGPQPAVRAPSEACCALHWRTEPHRPIEDSAQDKLPCGGRGGI